VKCPKTVSKCLLVLACVVASLAAVAADPSMAEVYQAAEAGHLAQAQTMIRQVLQDHPNSAKAHFVDAELLARQGQLSAARTELQIAERLAPGLPFAKASAVSSLQTQLAASPRITGISTLRPSVVSRGPCLWAPLLVLAGIMAAAYFFFRARNPQRAPAWNGTPVGPYAPANSAPAGYGNPTTYGMAPPVAPTASGGGIGSGVLGGLAAGAAAGAGMVAGQALMHRMLDGNQGTAAPLRTVDPAWETPAPTYDMGGDNFGVTDSGTWDDAGSGGDGGSDWN
jgi:uncharacterized protein